MNQKNTYKPKESQFNPNLGGREPMMMWSNQCNQSFPINISTIHKLYNSNALVLLNATQHYLNLYKMTESHDTCTTLKKNNHIKIRSLAPAIPLDYHNTNILYNESEEDEIKLDLLTPQVVDTTDAIIVSRAYASQYYKRWIQQIQNMESQNANNEEETSCKSNCQELSLEMLQKLYVLDKIWDENGNLAGIKGLIKVVASRPISTLLDIIRNKPQNKTVLMEVIYALDQSKNRPMTEDEKRDYYLLSMCVNGLWNEREEIFFQNNMNLKMQSCMTYF